MSATPGRQSGSGGNGVNTASLLRVGLFVSLALLIASTMPAPLMVASLSSLLWVGSLVSALAAPFVREPVFAPHLTRWDEAAMLMAVSLLLSFFVNRQAVIEHVEALQG